MRTAVLYPPFTKNGLYPLITQNRQFRYAHSLKVKIFPLVAASLATVLKNKGHEVLFLDGVTRRMSRSDFDGSVRDFNPELVFIETKAPLMNEIAGYIGKLREDLPSCRTVLFGDECTCRPAEALGSTDCDYVLTGGDYDHFGGLLADAVEKGTELPRGVYLKENGTVKGSHFELIGELDMLPLVDRDLTSSDLYEEAYLYHPCAYILTGRGCGARRSAGVCTFCIWQNVLWERTMRLHSPDRVAEEIEMLVKKYGAVEIFDDNESGAIYDFGWLEEFLVRLEKRDLIGRFFLSSNARADALDEKTCVLLKRIGYRLLKVGLESGTDKYLSLIGKGETASEIRTGIKNAKDQGLKIMLTVMTGFPDETDAEAEMTFRAAKELMLYKTRFGDCLQASILVPYPGTPLFKLLKERGSISPEANADEYSMEKSVIAHSIDANKWCRKIWGLHLDPGFLLRSLFTIRNKYDMATAMRGAASLFGHLKDF